MQAWRKWSEIFECWDKKTTNLKFCTHQKWRRDFASGAEGAPLLHASWSSWIFFTIVVFNCKNKKNLLFNLPYLWINLKIIWFLVLPWIKDSTNQVFVGIFMLFIFKLLLQKWNWAHSSSEDLPSHSTTSPPASLTSFLLTFLQLSCP